MLNLNSEHDGLSGDYFMNEILKYIIMVRKLRRVDQVSKEEI